MIRVLIVSACLLFSGCATTKSLNPKNWFPKAEQAQEQTIQEEQGAIVVSQWSTYGFYFVVAGIVLLIIPFTRHLGGWVTIGGLAMAIGAYYFVAYAQWFVGAIILSVWSWLMMFVGRHMEPPDNLITRTKRKLIYGQQATPPQQQEAS